MRLSDLSGGRVAIWGTGREGSAALDFIRRRLPDQPIVILDDNPEAKAPESPNVEFVFGKDRVAQVVGGFDVVVKSPGVSLYEPRVQQLRAAGVVVTSLLNLWFAEPRTARTICVTGTKGKSTTASLIARMLEASGARVGLVGNIGTPISQTDGTAADYIVVEVSSYQAADFAGSSDFSVLTNLFPEHLDWHRALDQYYRDKLNLLERSEVAVVNFDCAGLVSTNSSMGRMHDIRYFNRPEDIHARGEAIFAGERRIGAVETPHLNRAHNRSNLCGALSVCRELGIELEFALEASSSFCALPHRQQELGRVDDVLYVNDSISTTPESTLAALETYRGRPITLIAGGFDRGIDYDKLVDCLAAGTPNAVVLLGASGDRIYGQLRARTSFKEDVLYKAQSMADAVAQAKRVTPRGGVILLSPAAPSYGMYKDFEERGRHFAALAGLQLSM